MVNNVILRNILKKPLEKTEEINNNMNYIFTYHN